MSWSDAVHLAATNARRRPGRAALTATSVALAAALLTALLTITTTAQTRVLNQLAKGGPLAGIQVAAAAPDPAQSDQDNPNPGKAKDIDGTVLRQIRVLPEVHSVLPVVNAAVLTSRQSTTGTSPRRSFGDTMVGVALTDTARLPLTVIAGRLPTPSSLIEVAVTHGWLEHYGIPDADAAKALGTVIEVAEQRTTAVSNDRPVRVQTRWIRVQVVGVVTQDAGSGDLLVPLAQATAARGWITSGVDGGRSVGQSSSPYGGLLVVADSLDAVGRVRSRITAVGYSTSAPQNLIAAVRRYLGVVEIVLTAVGAIALGVAGLGITNALLAAVRERRREIGVLKAIGARDRDVMRVFLVEAGVLGLVGGIVGALVGYGLALLVGLFVNRYLTAQGLSGVQQGVPFSIMTAVTAGSTLVAVLGGTIPARRAARLPAREAVGGS